MHRKNEYTLWILVTNQTRELKYIANLAVPVKMIIEENGKTVLNEIGHSFINRADEQMPLFQALNK